MGADGALISIPLGIFFMWDEQKKQHYPHLPHLKSQNARVWAPTSQPEPTLQKEVPLVIVRIDLAGR